MKSLVGEIGSIKLNGEQVGGFKGWTVTQTPLQTTVKAVKYWLFKKVSSKVDVEFYTLYSNKLKLMHKRETELNLDGELDKMIDSVLVINLGMFDWLKP